MNKFLIYLALIVGCVTYNVAHAKEYKLYIGNLDMKHNDYYNQAISKLNNLLTEEDTLLLYINSSGGRLSIALKLANLIDRHPGKTIAYIDTKAASGGALIALLADEIRISKYCMVLVHWPFYRGSDGEKILISPKDPFFMISLKLFNDSVVKIMTKSEINAMLNGKDVVYTCQEVKKRFDKRGK